MTIFLDFRLESRSDFKNYKGIINSSICNSAANNFFQHLAISNRRNANAKLHLKHNCKVSSLSHVFFRIYLLEIA
jgi:hypothetical protein